MDMNQLSTLIDELKGVHDSPYDDLALDAAAALEQMSFEIGVMLTKRSTEGALAGMALSENAKLHAEVEELRERLRTDVLGYSGKINYLNLQLEQTRKDRDKIESELFELKRKFMGGDFE